MIDRQFLVSPERTPTLGTVTRATDSSFNCEVSFRGRSYECKSAGKNALAVGDSVSFVQIDQTPWVIKSDALYPTRFKRPLTDWAGHHKYNLLLQYLISKGARKNYTFQTGTAQGAASDSTLSVLCWDGKTRTLPVEYAGSAKPAADFSSGDQVLIYQKTPNQWVSVGKLDTTPWLKMNVLLGLNPLTNYFAYGYEGSDGTYHGIYYDESNFSFSINETDTKDSFYIELHAYELVTHSAYPTLSVDLSQITGSGIKLTIEAYDSTSHIVDSVEYVPSATVGNSSLARPMTTYFLDNVPQQRHYWGSFMVRVAYI